jgi:hypothetical protein
MNDPISILVGGLVSLLILYGIISATVGGVKKELRTQTLILGLMAQKDGVTTAHLGNSQDLKINFFDFQHQPVPAQWNQ